MKTIFNVLMALLFASLLMSCTFIRENTETLKPSKNYITRDFNVTDFTAIDAITVSDIHYTQSTDGKCTLTIYGPDNFVELIQVSIKDKTLKLTMDKHKKIKNAQKLKITISSPHLNRIDFKGVGDIIIDDKLTTSRLDIESKGVGNINIQDLDCQNLMVSSMGVGNVEIKGKAENATLYSKGVGDISAIALEAVHVTASSSGVGNISCNAIQSIDASVRGVGSIDYKGSPEQKVFNKKGVGSIKNI